MSEVTTTVSPVEISTLDEQLPAVVPSKQTSSDFEFNAVHNGAACIESLDPKDKGTERQYRFTRALLCTLLGVKSQDTITNHVDKLLKRGVIEVTKNLVTLKVPSQSGIQETTLYDLKVFNYLVMRLDTDQAWEMKAKFNDVLVERETGTQTPMMCLPQDYESALEALLVKVRENKALQAERDEALHAESLAKEASDQSFKARATAMGRLSNIRFRENDVKASERMAANGHPSKSKKFTVQNVMDVAWFQILFKASQMERFYNGNPAWKPIIKSLKRLLSLKANNVVRNDLGNRFHEELSATKAKKVFSLWMKAKEGGTPFHESLAEINLGDMAVSLGSYIDEMVCLSERYSYTRSNGDTAYGIVYGYAYDVWARVLSSLYFREISDYLRDNVDPEDFENTLYSVRSECYGLR